MLPILYDKSSTMTDFTSNNGLGVIATATKCVITEERNGLYELELTASTSDRLADEIKPLAIIKAMANPKDDPQLFEIYSIKKDSRHIVANAQHIRYRLSGNVFTEAYYPASNMTPTQVWADIQDVIAYNSDFTFSSNITSALRPTAAANCPVRVGEFLLGKDGSMLDTYGGEYHFDNFDVSLMSSRGQTLKTALRLGSGISSLTYDSNTDNCYTDIAPFTKVPYMLTSGAPLGEIFVTIAKVSTTAGTEINILPYNRALVYDFTDVFLSKYPQFVVESSNGQSPTSESWSDACAKLSALTNRYISQNKHTLILPDISISVDVQTGYEQLNECGLCDTIPIYYEPFDMQRRLKIVKMQFDSISEKVINVELSSFKKSIDVLFADKNIGGT